MSVNNPSSSHLLPSAATTITRGLNGRCPRCGEGRLFSGFLNLRNACERCGLDFAFADAGDGPAVFVILFAGFVIAGLALITEVLWQPSLLVHALLWGPLTVLVCIGPLRPLKGLLIGLQYRFRAEEGRFVRPQE